MKLIVVYGAREANFDDACTRARSVHVNWYGAQSPSLFSTLQQASTHESTTSTHESTTIVTYGVDNMTTWALYYTVRTYVLTEILKDIFLHV